MKTNFSLLFYLKKPKNYVKGAVPVYLRITVDGKPVEMSASRKCEPELWNTKAGHMIGTKEDAKTLNSYLDKMKAGVPDLQSIVQTFHKLITYINILVV